MSRLTPEQAAEVKACEGLYRLSDVARHYGVNKSTISRVWNGQRHGNVLPASEAPNVFRTGRAFVGDYAEDIPVLFDRGLGVKEVAQALGLGLSTIYRGVA